MSDARLMIEDCTKPDGGYVEISGFVDGVLPSSDNWIIRDDEPMPDGRIDGGVFRPLMIECPECFGTGKDFSGGWWDEFGCCVKGKVRNPALNWQKQCEVHHHSRWVSGSCSFKFFVENYEQIYDVGFVRKPPIQNCSMVWVAVGLTP